MTRPVIRRELADRDADAAIRHYRAEAGVNVAIDFVAALNAAYASIASQPSLGSPRYGEELGLPGLRHWPLKRFPHLVFYVERPDHIEVWRILHGHRDVRTAIQEEPEPQ